MGYKISVLLEPDWEYPELGYFWCILGYCEKSKEWYNHRSGWMPSVQEAWQEAYRVAKKEGLI